MSFNPKAYKLLSFDIYAPPQQPHLSDSPDAARRYILSEYAALETQVQAEQPGLTYSTLLSEVHTRLCARLSIPPSPSSASAFGASIGTWPAFPDTVAAMQLLSRHYRLVALSNVDRASFSNTLSGPLSGVAFDAVFTAQDIGSYKPDLRNFKYLINGARQKFRVEKREILHVAQSLFHDHVPVRKMGLRPGVWIAREGRASAIGGDFEILKEKGEVDVARVFETLGELAEEVRGAFKE